MCRLFIINLSVNVAHGNNDMKPNGVNGVPEYNLTSHMDITCYKSDSLLFVILEW